MRYLSTILMFFSLQLNATELWGVLPASQECLQNQEAMVWVGIKNKQTKTKKLLTHVPSKIGGDFSIHLKPGEYEIEVTTQDGCFSSQHVKLTKENTKIAFRTDR